MKILPGEIAYTDIMVSSVPRPIIQIARFLTSKKFNYTSFFADHKIDFTFAYHQTSTSADEIIIMKRAYELELRKYRKEVRYYHTGNSTYAIAKYKEEIEDKKQTLAFCSVGSHHQNSKAEY